PRDLHSFPTRRSSDLVAPARGSFLAVFTTPVMLEVVICAMVNSTETTRIADSSSRFIMVKFLRVDSMAALLRENFTGMDFCCEMLKKSKTRKRMHSSTGLKPF